MSWGAESSHPQPMAAVQAQGRDFETFHVGEQLREASRVADIVGARNRSSTFGAVCGAGRVWRQFRS